MRIISWFINQRKNITTGGPILYEFLEISPIPAAQRPEADCAASGAEASGRLESVSSSNLGSSGYAASDGCGEKPLKVARFGALVMPQRVGNQR